MIGCDFVQNSDAGITTVMRHLGMTTAMSTRREDVSFEQNELGMAARRCA